MSQPTTTLGSSPLSAAHLDDAGGNPLFVATPRRATSPAADLGSLACLDARRDVVAMVAIDYREELQAVADRLPVDDEGRMRLDTLLMVIGHAVEAEAAFRAECQAVAPCPGCKHQLHAFDVCSCGCDDRVAVTR